MKRYIRVFRLGVILLGSMQILSSKAFAGFVYLPQTVPWTVSGTATETATVISTFTASVTAVLDQRTLIWQSFGANFSIVAAQNVIISRSGSTPNGINIVPNCTGTGFSVADGPNFLGSGSYCLLVAGELGPVTGNVTYTNPVTQNFSDSASQSGAFNVAFDTATAQFVSTGNTNYTLIFQRPDGTVANGTLSNVSTTAATTNPNVTLQRTGTTNGIFSAKINSQVAQPPSVPTYSTSTVVTAHILSPVALSWGASTDSDGNPVTYNIFLGPSPSNLTFAAGLSTPTFSANVLSFGTTTYWQVSAVDDVGLVSTGPVAGFVVDFINHPPNSFSVISGTGTLFTRNPSVNLSWQANGDPDGDIVNYALSLSTVSPSNLQVIQTSTNTIYTLPLQFGTTVYWSVNAVDPFGASTAITGGAQTFLPIFQSGAPGQPQINAPFTANPTIQTMHNNVVISWEQVQDPQNDPITYTAYLGNSPQNLQALTRINQPPQGSTGTVTVQQALSIPNSQVQVNGNTVQLMLSGLGYNQNYYFQLVASNPFGTSSSTAVQSFSLSPQPGFPKAYNYPNPFNPNRGGTNIVFNAPASGYGQAVVEVLSEWQDLLFKQTYPNIPPGISQIHFDGKDRYGRAFFNGSYICRVKFSNPDDQQIFYLLVVK